MDGYRLGAAARAEGHRLHVHDRLGSTNAEALARARDGESGPLWIVARHQEAGRGRRGSAWESLPGNLAASLLWPVLDVDPADVPTLGFVAGVALIGALEQACPGEGDRRRPFSTPQPHPEVPERSAGLAAGFRKSPPELKPSCGAAGAAPRDGGAGGDRASACQSPFRLKWPNDVLASGAKLAGLLLETETHSGGRRSVVMGFGVNVADAPQGLPYPATCLRQWRHDARAEDLFELLSNQVVDAARIWRRGRGFSDIRTLWLERAAGIGAPLAVRTGGETVQGIFETIDEAGRLVVETDDGTRRTVTAGEVHLGTAATAV